ncbi:MAG: hypothetical protein ACRDZ8_18725 [Acidimicrobiales bacterium]
MTQTPITNLLPRNRQVAAVAALALIVSSVLTGCTDLRRNAGPAAKLPGGVAVPQVVSSSDQVWVALSTATPSLTPRLVDQLGQVVVPTAVAMGRRDGRAVTLEVFALDEATASQAAQLAAGIYPRVTSDTNPLVAQRETNEATSKLLSQLQASLARRAAAPTEDPVGALALLADTAGQVPDAQQHVLGVILGDGLSSTDNCDTTLLPAADAQQVDLAARECLAGAALDLNGTPIWLDGIGLDPTGGQFTPTQLDRARTILERIIQLADGRLCRAAPVLLPARTAC